MYFVVSSNEGNCLVLLLTDAQLLKHERTDKALTVSIVSRRDFFGFSWESVKICLTVGNQAIIASL